MAVMNKLRENTKIILVILLLAFGGLIVFEWGMSFTGLRSGPKVIGKIDGVEISGRQFDDAFARELEGYRTRTGRDAAENQLDFLRDQTWESLVREVLIQKALQRKNITTHDKEIVYRLFNDPPAIIRSNPNFQNEQKQFDMAKYQQVLNDPNFAAQWRPLEEYLRQTLPYEKLQQRLQASVRVTEDEIKREYLKQNQKASVNYVFINPKKYSSGEIEIPDNLVKKYYNEHKKDFGEEEQRRIQYLLFPIKATAQDSAAQYELAGRLIERAKNGEDFADLAEIYSEDAPSKDKGGDLGFFQKGDMLKPFEEAAFSAELGSIVGPVETQYGIHVIKVEDKKTEDGKEKVKASHILLKFEPSRKTENSARDAAEIFAEEAATEDFSELAAQIGDSTKTTGFFRKGNGFVPGLGLNKRASNFIFVGKDGDIGEVIESTQGLFVFKIFGIEKEHTKSLESVSNEIKTKLIAEKQMEHAEVFSNKIYEKVQNGAAFVEAVAQDSLEIKETTPFSRGGFVAGVGREPNFIGAAFRLGKSGDISKPVSGTKGYYILQLKEKSEFDENDFKSVRQRLAADLLQRKQSQVFANWYANLRAKADIEDNRNKFF